MPSRKGCPLSELFSSRAVWCAIIPTVPSPPASRRCHIPTPSWKMNWGPCWKSPCFAWGLLAPRGAMLIPKKNKATVSRLCTQFCCFWVCFCSLHVVRGPPILQVDGLDLPQ